MQQIPLYDANLPVACTIGANEIPERVELVERMRANLLSVERTPDGLLLRFPETPENAADVRRFTVDEKRCCQFWGFAIDHRDNEVRLQWDGPPAASELLVRLHRYFTGNEPVRTLAGLL